MDDLIQRQAAIDAMATWDWQELYLPIHFKQLLEDLPSVSTEKTGRWKKGFGNTSCTCSECGSNGVSVYKFCPWCGARIVGPQESEVQDADSD